jgi:hypothetical protein
VNDEATAVALARGRIAIGIAAIAAPRLASRVMGGAGAASGVTPLFARMLGARDAALGLGAVIALDRGKPVRGWLEAAALSDSVDLGACVLARDQMPGPVFRGMAALAAASALAHVWLATRLDPAPPPHPGHPEAIATGHGSHAVA